MSFFGISSYEVTTAWQFLDNYLTRHAASNTEKLLHLSCILLLVIYWFKPLNQKKNHRIITGRFMYRKLLVIEQANGAKISKQFAWMRLNNLIYLARERLRCKVFSHGKLTSLLKSVTWKQSWIFWMQTPAACLARKEGWVLERLCIQHNLRSISHKQTASI